VGITLYVLSVFLAYSIVVDVSNIIPLIETLSQLSLSYRLEKYELVSTASEARVMIDLLVNITWNRYSDLKGPVLKFIYKNNELGVIDIEKLDKPVINRRISISLNFSKNDLDKNIYLNILVRTGIGNFSALQKLANISWVLSLSSLSIENIRLNGVLNKLSFDIVSPNHVKAPLKFVIYDQYGNQLYSWIEYDFEVGCGKGSYHVETNVPSSVFERGERLSVELYGFEYTLVSITQGG